ncbi:MAG: phenylalanine--tRNA ligase subunit beta [Candidatus Pacearchaeota archaeon]|nr:phenylalanine--tRNA ligase subunit beta [Candidatus Pacearchaeota archaeon]
MATLNISKKEIEKHIKLTEENIEKIMMMGIPIEISEDNVTIEITPNRPDLLSLQGLLRYIKSYLGKEPGLKKYKINKPEKNYKIKIDSSVNNIRPYTVCAIIKNLKFDNEKIKEIIDIQEKLHATIGRNRKKAAIGIYPLEKITLPIRYEARSPNEIKFIPLEANEEMNALEILQRTPTGREYAHLLDFMEKYPIFLDAKGKILSMPPIINSQETGKITPSTKDVFIECSGSDFFILKKILNIIVSALIDLGGKAYAMELEYGKNKITTPDFTPEKMKISLENANKLLGLNLKEKDLEKLLPRMGYNYKNGKIEIPAWRTDILHEVDIIEDIAIAYGYDNFIPEIPKVATIGEESKETKIESKIAETLIGLGLIETSSYHLIKIDEAKKAKLKENEKIELETSKTEFKLVRPNLLIPSLRIFAENKDNEYPQKIFEIGTIFEKDNKTETGIKETKHLLIALSPGNFTEIKQTFDYLSRMLDIKYEIEQTERQGLIEGRTGKIIINNKETGFIGEVHPETLKEWNIKLPVALLEISLEEIFKCF